MEEIEYKDVLTLFLNKETIILGLNLICKEYDLEIEDNTMNPLYRSNSRFPKVIFNTKRENFYRICDLLTYLKRYNNKNKHFFEFRLWYHSPGDDMRTFEIRWLQYK